jgi:hypothetical protein
MVLSKDVAACHLPTLVLWRVFGALLKSSPDATCSLRAH